MDNPNTQVAERVKEANNILVTVSSDPSVDQLAACIGVTLSLNKMGKHATAVFSGKVPSTIEFLQPDKTLEKNTDSLRDFIISLDKSKADKLRYKVEDKVVKIFITPYKTSIGEKDLEFSQGDFNVDVVLAIGVHSQTELDQAITAHGRILHDATVVTLNTKPGGELGSINWLDPTASSLSELGAQLIDLLDKSLMDSQIATALLTGIVAATARFSNNKTSPRTMTISAELMTAGANQQLVATKLEAPQPAVTAPAPRMPIAEAEHDHEAPAVPVQKANDGTLEISHEAEEKTPEPLAEVPAVAKEEPAPEAPAAPEVEPQAEKADELDQPETSDDVASATEPTLETKAAPTLEPLAEEPHVAEAKLPEIKPRDVAADTPSQPAPESNPEPVILPAPVEPIDVTPVVPPQIHIDEHGSLSPLDTLPPVHSELPTISHHDAAPRMVVEPPTMGGQLTANTATDSYDAAVPYGMPVEEGTGSPVPAASPSVGTTIQPPADDTASVAAPFLLGDSPAPAPVAPAIQAQIPPEPIEPSDTLSDIEQAVHSSHLQPAPAVAPAAPAPVVSVSEPAPLPAPAFTTAAQPPAFINPFEQSSQQPAIPAPAPAPSLTPPPAYSQPLPDLTPDPVVEPQAEVAPVLDPGTDLQGARDAVMQAINGAEGVADAPLPAKQSLNAMPVDLPLGHDAPPAAPQLPAPADAAPWNPAAPAGPVAYPTTSVYDQLQPVSSPAPAVVQPDDPNAPPPVPPPMMPPSNPYTQPY